ncbi:helix-turn-helix domain-containing protein [Microvirga rosea]|uniref:helix-turn-helix domain-containing protein n=1 Tax=Microvirga rosea TaxID=2715425 RepID=UPI001D0A3C38|nr:helix-turn-helix domain-containing protein [Microvirga rosea]MCB8820754.1 helix-turn-helix domain-containing protein [Microvirga rosea]
MAQFYAVPVMRLVQPITATLIPPLAWIALETTAVRRFNPRRDLPHLAVPAFTTFCIGFAPQTLDIVVPGIFTIYGLAMFQSLRAGPDGLPLIRSEVDDWPILIWRGVALALMLSAASDWLIAAAQIAGEAWLQSWIITLTSSVSLLLIGALSLSESLETDEEPIQDPETAPSPADVEKDMELMSHLDAILAEHQMFLDPNLNLARLARRSAVPAKQLSITINRATGQNVSRYINSYRIRHACERLAAGSSVTNAMLESGFNTKSNFNREFQRVTGQSPTSWLANEHNRAARGREVASKGSGIRAELN